MLLAITIYGLVKIGDNAKYLKDLNILKVLGSGLFLTIISSLVLFFHPTNSGGLRENKTDSVKEKTKNDDLFK